MERQLLRKGNSRVSPHQTTKKLQTGVIYHPVHGYPIAPPVPVAVARRNARERNRVKTVNDSYQHLKNHVPGAARQKRMSKVDIIKHSIDYIQKLQKSLRESESPASDVSCGLSECPGSEDRLTPRSTDSGYLSPQYCKYTSSSSFSSSPSLPPSIPPAQNCSLQQVLSVLSRGDPDGDVLDAIIDWQDT